jgi:hypothetical protein
MPRAGTYIRASDFATTDHVPVASPDWPEHRRALFDRIARSRPAGWWDSSNEGLLVEYVLAVEAAQNLQALLDDLDRRGVDVAASIGELHGLLRQRDRECRRAITLARLQRLAQIALPPRAEGRDVPSDPAKAPWADA